MQPQFAPPMPFGEAAIQSKLRPFAQAIGLPLGFLNAYSRFFEDTIGVLALGLQTLPSVCWIPLALLWFGQSEGAMLLLS